MVVMLAACSPHPACSAPNPDASNAGTSVLAVVVVVVVVVMVVVVVFFGGNVPDKKCQ